MNSSVSYIVIVGSDLHLAQHAVDLLCRTLKIESIEEIVVVYVERGGQVHELPPLADGVRVRSIELMMLRESEDGDASYYGLMQQIIVQRVRANHRVHLCVAGDELAVPVAALLVGSRCLRDKDGMWLLNGHAHAGRGGWQLRSLPLRPIELLRTNSYERRCEFLENSLTPREREIVQHLVQSRLSNREIGARIGISERRVEKTLSESIYPQLRRFLGREQVSRQDLVAEFAMVFDMGLA
jgi:hypothetical protein